MDAALDRGLRVRGFARSADSLAPRDGLEPFAGDAQNPDDLARALDGARAVIYALGIRERAAMIWQKETLFSRTTTTLIGAMQATGVNRLIAVTGFGAGRSRDAMSALEKLGQNAVLGRVYDDKTRQEALIMQSALDWTIVRPVILTNGARTGKAQVLRSPQDTGATALCRAVTLRRIWLMRLSTASTFGRTWFWRIKARCKLSRERAAQSVAFAAPA